MRVSELFYSVCPILVALVGTRGVQADRCNTIDFHEEDCAIGFGERDCLGLEVRFQAGYRGLPWLTNNAIASVVVKPGCQWVAYEHSGTTQHVRGQDYVLDATQSQPRVIKNLIGRPQLEGRVSSVDCFCTGQPQANQWIEPESGGGPPLVEGCQAVSFTGSTACILYDQPGCHLGQWHAPIFVGDGDEPQFFEDLNPQDTMYPNTMESQVLLDRLESPPLANAVESVSVLRGCTLELFDSPNYREGFQFRAPNDADWHATLADHDRYAFLSGHVQSARCYCDYDALK